MSSAKTVVTSLLALVGLVVIAAASSQWGIFWFGLFGIVLLVVWRSARNANKRVAILENELQQERCERVEGFAVFTSRLNALQAARRQTFEQLLETVEPVTPEREVVAEPEATTTPQLAAEPVEETVPELPVEEEPAYVPPPEPAPPRPTWADAVRSVLNVEQMLGTNWLIKIGVAILVLGIAFFLAWQLRELGPLGKIVVGVVLSGALLGAGLWGERSGTYRILGRASLAGGWPLLFFVSYAAYHIPAARVISSPLAALVLMLIVVAAMVWHTLRFCSQVVTGLAFTLAFTTVALNRADVYSLTANVILAIGFSFVVVRMKWFRLEIFGILAIYLNHYIWLTPIIEPMHGKVHPFPQFYASAIILILYWAVFRLSYVVRPPVDEKTSTVAGVLNTALLGGVMKYQSAHPEFAFWALLALGSVEIGLARLPIVRRKRLSFIALTAIGATLVVEAIPFRYAATYVAPIWLLEAELFFFIGVLTRERIYRLLGALAAGITAIQLISVPVARLMGARLGDTSATHEWVLGIILTAAMIALYADANWAPRRWPDLFANPADRTIARYLTFLAALMGVIAGWAMFPDSGAAVVWIALAVILAAIAHRFTLPDLTIQANLIAVAAGLRVLLINLPSGASALNTPLHITYRLLTVSAVAAMLYLLSRWNRSTRLAISRSWPDGATWAGSTLVTLLMWYELRPISVAIAWTIVGLTLLEIGEVRQSLNLRLQAYVALAAAFVRVFVVNMNADQIGTISPRVYTILPIAIALIYVYDRLETRQPRNEADHRPWLPGAFAWGALACVVTVLRFELGADVVAIAWAALTLLLVATGALSGRRVFLHIGIAVALATLFRGALHNLYERSYFPPPGKLDTWMLVGSTVAILLASLPFAFRSRRTPPIEGKRVLTWLDSRPEQILFFVPLLLTTILLATEMRRGMLTVAWGIEAVVVFVFALWMNERSYRLAGLALLLLCIGKVFLFDFWSLGLRDKAMTGIVMGVVLIGVSVLYTRKKEAILRLL